MTKTFSTINEAKANFDDIYRMDDPRAYFSVLGDLDYMIPDVAEPILRQILAARTRADAGRRPTVLDIGCSYGINAAVHRFPVSFELLRQRYARREIANVDSKRLIELDRHFYAAWPDTGLARFVGLDISQPAIDYAKTVGLIDDGVAANLETDPLTPDQARTIGQADVVLATGAIGYVTEKTYRKILDATQRQPWIVSFVLRMFPHQPFETAFAERGLVTERLTGATFIQRRFRDRAEFDQTLKALHDAGIDSQGFETEGLFQADLYVTRPEADVLAQPLDEIVSIASGRDRTRGPRFVQHKTPSGAQVTVEA